MILELNGDSNAHTKSSGIMGHNLFVSECQPLFTIGRDLKITQMQFVRPSQKSKVKTFFHSLVLHI